MDFGEVKKGLYDAWEFLWIPILCLFVTALLARILAPLVAQRIARGFLGACRATTGSDYHETLKQLGLTKLVPVIVVIIGLVFLFLVREIALFVGELAPGYVTISPGSLIGSLPNTWDIARVWSQYPQAEDPQELLALIEYRLSTIDEKGPLVRTYVHWREETAEAHTRLLLVKFFMIWALAMAGCGMATHRPGILALIARFILIESVLCVFGLYYIANYVVAAENEHILRIRAALVLSLESKSGSVNKDELTVLEERIRSREYPHFSVDDHWWTLTTGYSQKLSRYKRLFETPAKGSSNMSVEGHGSKDVNSGDGLEHKNSRESVRRALGGPPTQKKPPTKQAKDEP